MIVRALKAGIMGKFLLMDSWFAIPALISEVCKRISVICMVKRTPKILANAQIEFKDGLKAKLVFLRNKHKRDWLALLTTNLTLANDDVVRITVSAGTLRYSSARAIST